MIGAQCYTEARSDCVEEHFAPMRIYVDFTLDPAAGPRIKMNAAFLRIDVDLCDVIIRERLDNERPQIPSHYVSVRFLLISLWSGFAHVVLEWQVNWFCQGCTRPYSDRA